MEKGMLSILVFSGLCNCMLYPHQRVYHFINEAKTWPEAQECCKTTHIDLATINDLQDLERVAGLTAPRNPFVFLGLYKRWSWSESLSDDYTEGEQAYWNWAHGQPIDHQCGSMGPTGELFATNCSVKMNFSCYIASAKELSERFTLEKDGMTWADAQAHCRRTHTDLAVVRNQLENEELRRIVKNGYVWVGLAKASWMWSDGSYPSFLPWKGLKPLIPQPFDCVALDVSSKCLGMRGRKCDEAAPFVCSGDPAWKYFQRVKFFADDSSLDLNDPAVETSLLNWVKDELKNNKTNARIKVRWVKLPENDTNGMQET